MPARLALRGLTGLLIIAFACVAAPGSAQDGSEAAVQRAGRETRKVQPGASARITAGGAQLEIEAGTVEVETEIEISPLAGAEVAALDPGMTNVTGGGHGYRFGPHGSHFRKALRLTLPYDDRLLPPGMTSEDVRAFYFDESLGRWVPLERVSVEPGTGSVVSLTDHFTDIIAATLAVPNHPEVASFVPTQMQDMKAANPAQGIAMIQPPEPNPLGEARLSFPIDVPPGRNALQPSLQISYASNGGNGWLGVGWALDVPAIDVDTRWGVPRYGMLPDASGAIEYRAKETETYLMSGAELTPLAHRGAFADRTGIEKQFHARVEGSFHRILRHGDHPSNFWWEVIDRDGVRSLYGESPVTGPGPATLRDGAGNIFRWALREVRDPHGNAMRFDYDLASDPGIPGGTEDGRQLYLRTIDYTGSAVGDGAYQPGAYTVRFVRDSDPALAPHVKRNDVQIDARGGFLQVTAELLRKIRVEFDGALVREYELDYKRLAFGKTLLGSLRQAGADGVPIPGAEHTFIYHDELRDGSGEYTYGFGEKTTWSVPFDDVTLCNELGPVEICPSAIPSAIADLDRASLLGGSITHSVGGHAYLGLNCGLPVKQNSFGLKVGFNNALTNTRLALMDVDGDGLPDKVFKSASGFEYRANQARPGGSLSFSADARPLHGVDAISTEVATTRSVGPEAYIGGFSVLGNVAGTLSVGTTYSTDANGDGFADIIRNGKILFGRMGVGGLTYEATSALTPLPLAAGTVDGGGLIEDFEPQFQDQVDQNPLIDVFRRWLAPYDGDVLIQGSVRLATPSETADGVRVSIQHNESVLWSAEIPAGDAVAHAPSGVERVTVSRGDRLYFRVQSVFDGSQDAVEWDPEIQYLDVPPAPDANRLDAHRYRASEDFVLAGRSGRARMPSAGDVHVTGVLEKADTTSDDVTVSVRKNDAEIHRATMRWDSIGQAALDLRFSVAGDDSATKDIDEADRLFVQLVVDSPIDTRRVRWLADAPPELVYEAVPGAQAFTQAGDALIRMLLPSDLDLYPASDLTAPQAAWEAPSDGTISVTTALSGDWSFRVIGLEDPVQDGEIAFTVKRAGALLARDTVNVSGMHAGNVTVGGINVTQGDSLYFDYSMRNASARGTVGARVTYSAPQSATAVDVPSALHTNVDFDDAITLGRGLFSQPNRGWSYAGYNGNPDRDSPERPHACSGPRVSPTPPIREADLVLDEGLALVALRKQARAESSADSGAVETQKAYAMSPVFERLADGSLRASWRGPDESSWVQAGSTSATRLGVDLVEVPCASDLESGGAASDQRAIPRIGVSGNAGAAAGFFISVGGSVGRSTSNLDFLDMNGDQFPDLVGLGRAQFTLPNGGLEARNRPLATLNQVRFADNFAASISLGGTVPWTHGGSRGTMGANSKSSPRGERSENLMPSLGFSGDLGGGGSTVKSELIDLNGDGLPDRVLNDGSVSLNLGYSFAAPVAWPGFTGLDRSFNAEASLGVGLGFNDFIYGWAGGLSYTRAFSTTERSLVDMNGDGLPDRVRQDLETVWVAFNTGNGFGPEVRWTGAALTAIASASNASLGGGGFVTIPVPIFMCSPVTVLFLIVNPGITVSSGMARQQSALLDVNGDGYPDHVESKRDDELIFAPNNTGRTNLLASVHRPLGGDFGLDYERIGNTPELPRSVWALSRVLLDDGLADDGPPSLITTFSYAQPHYDRGEREFLGFAEVTEANSDASDPTRVMRSVVRTFRNDSHYSRGLIASETTRDGQGRPFRGTTFEHRFRDVATGVVGAPLGSRTATIFPMMVATETRLFEGSAGPGLRSRRTLEYDGSGNVSRIEDGGEPGSDDALEATITYTSCAGSPVRSRPTGIVVRSNGVTLAEREGTLDCATGDVLQIRQRVGDGTEAVTDLTYFPSGELKRVVGPANLHGQRYALTYEYDNRLGTHVTRVENSFGLVSTATHDLRFGSPLSTTDANGQVIDYAYDAFGRLARVTGPNERGTGQPTLTYEYHPEALRSWARTRHQDTVRGLLDPIETILFADGLGRVIQTKVDGTVHTSPATPAEDVMLVSGRTRFDGFGRATEQYQPVAETPGSGTLFAATFDANVPSRVQYDVLDRPISVTLPNGSTTRYSYALAPDRTGELRQETTILDANGRRQRLYRDEQDALVAVREGERGDVWTTYRYDALGRLASITDALGNVTRMAYDGLGRRTELVRPDAGTTRYEYDPASNLVALRTANLLARGEAIRYDYEFTRLSAVHYPAVPDAARALGPGFHGRTLPAEDITYTYGGPGAADNAAGRLVRITDPSGFEERAYGRLGEVVRQTRRIEGLDHKSKAQTFTTQYRYDTWGRLLGITYPAGEVLTYEYDAGGRVARVTGRDRGQTFEYLRRLEYDKFQQQAYLELGNGVSTSASYRPEDQRLDRLQTASAAGEFQDLRFTYDPVGNIRSIVNDVGPPPLSALGGPIEQHFEYDELYRLTGASGVRALAREKRDEYTLSLRYDAIHNLLEKRQRHDIVEPSGHRVAQRATSDDFKYRYSPSQPHAAVEVSGREFTFDANGNQTSATRAFHESRRSIVWDDEDRVRSVFVNGRETRFAYDASGTRVLKSGHGDEVAYFNQFLTVRNGELVTQHVFVGDKRLASRLIGTRKGNSKKAPDDLYYLHADPLGSTQFVTNAAGDVTEHLEYFPFGEIWVDDSKRGAISDLKFSGRELDEETGLYYFGARYQDPELGQFLSVNPASASEGGQLVTSSSAPFSVYAFANDNPVRLQNASGLTPSWWSQLGQTAALFQGAAGPSVGGSRAPPASSDVFDDTDSPVLAAAASGSKDFVAGGGVGVFDASSPDKSVAAARHNRSIADAWGGGRSRSNAVVGERPEIGRERSNAVVGERPTAGTRARSNAVVGGGLQTDEKGKGPIILGENMDGRVTPYARSVGGETIVDWLDGRKWTQQLNDDYVEWIKAEGRSVIDIGPDYARRLQRSLNPSSNTGFACVYCGEAKQLGGYTKVRQVFQWLGGFQGGVSGLDVIGKPEGGPEGMQQ